MWLIDNVIDIIDSVENMNIQNNAHDTASPVIFKLHTLI